MQKLICFDFDDVLVNNKMVFKLPLIGHKLRTFELGAQFIEGNMDPKKFNAFVGEVMKQVKGVHIDHVMKLLLHMRLQKGARETLAKLKKNGYKIVIISINDETFIRRFLEKHHLLEYVSHIYAARFGLKNGIMTGKIYGDVIKMEKTEIVARLEKIYKLKRREIVYVGDGLTDLPIIKKVGYGILFNPNAITKMEIFTNKQLKKMENEGKLFLAEGKDLRCVLDFVPNVN
ncbi:MAG: HAD-IB family phosphatase [Candidatus Aenigmatarchaeota archaeon]